jgi:transposase
MAAYSMDLRERVFEDRRGGLSSKDVAAKYRVSRAWVNRLMQRHRETGALIPRKQTKFRAQALAGHETQLKALVDAQPDRTLAEIREALCTSASISAIWRALDRLGITVKKNRSRRRTTSPRRRD